MSIAMRAAGLVSLSFGVAAWSIAGAQSAPQNWTIAFKTTIDSGNGRTMSTAIRYQIAGRKMRMEVVSGGPAAAQMAGMYMIASESDSSLTAVIPGQQMAMTTNTPGAQVIEFVRAHMKVTDFSLDRIEDLGVGEPLLAHPTHHYRVSVSSTTNATLAGQVCSRRQSNSIETWMAADVDAAPVFETVARRFGAGGTDPNTNAFSMPRNDAIPKGTPMRSVTTMTNVGTQPAGDKVISTMEITELSNAPVDTTAFVVPGGLRTMDMRTMMAMPTATMDSVLEASLLKTMQGSCAPPKNP